MSKKTKSKDFLHKVPADLLKALHSSSKIVGAWNNLTPLARNEWICWIISVKKEETRKNHIVKKTMCHPGLKPWA